MDDKTGKANAKHYKENSTVRNTGLLLGSLATTIPLL
jgi:hypothetical protein